MGRTWAIIERELRRFRRSPILIVMSMVMPIMQLVVLGYAFGGNVKHLKLAVVDQDHSVPAVKIRELASAIVVRRAAPSTRSSMRTRARRSTTCATDGSTASSPFRRISRGACWPRTNRRSR